MHIRPKEESMDELFEAILKLKSVEECHAFFDDLCTVAELLAMQQRLMVAKLLKKGSIYSDIVEATGASTATISRVNRALSYGKGGYEMVLERLEK
ncbi:YerC/YecD family TrpR-related protein [Acidaminobacterium chupaoyuni]